MNTSLADVIPPDDGHETLEDKIDTSLLKIHDAVKKIEFLKKPKTWSKKSCAPYYRSEYGHQMLHVFESILKDRQPIIWRYNDPRWNNISPRTLYAKINQSIKWLLDYLDQDYKYQQLYEALDVYKKKGVGIVMELREDILQQQIIDNPEAFMPTKVVTDNSEWRDKMEDFIQNGTVEVPFVATKLSLSDEEQEQLRLELSGVENLIVIVTSEQVKLVKMQ